MVKTEEQKIRQTNLKPEMQLYNKHYTYTLQSFTRHTDRRTDKQAVFSPESNLR